MKYEVNVVDGCAYLHGNKRKGETSSYLLMDASTICEQGAPQRSKPVRFILVCS
jgi:hypothetical protein